MKEGQQEDLVGGPSLPNNNSRWWTAAILHFSQKTNYSAEGQDIFIKKFIEHKKA